jgi:hypothetical protein
LAVVASDAAGTVLLYHDAFFTALAPQPSDA